MGAEPSSFLAASFIKDSPLQPDEVTHFLDTFFSYNFWNSRFIVKISYRATKMPNYSLFEITACINYNLLRLKIVFRLLAPQDTGF
jgi:hypothetical protein